MSRIRYPWDWLWNRFRSLASSTFDNIEIRSQVTRIVKRADGSLDIRNAHNIVTIDGDIYYAMMLNRIGGVPEVPTTEYFTNGVTSLFDGVCEIRRLVENEPVRAANRSNIGGVQVGLAKTCSAGYPKRGDLEPLNTGKGIDIQSYRFDWGEGEAVGVDVNSFDITNPSPASNEKLLCWGKGIDFTGGANDTVILFVNHGLDGVASGG